MSERIRSRSATGSFAKSFRTTTDKEPALPARGDREQAEARSPARSNAATVAALVVARRPASPPSRTPRGHPASQRDASRSGRPLESSPVTIPLRRSSVRRRRLRRPRARGTAPEAAGPRRPASCRRRRSRGHVDERRAERPGPQVPRRVAGRHNGGHEDQERLPRPRQVRQAPSRQIGGEPQPGPRAAAGHAPHFGVIRLGHEAAVRRQDIPDAARAHRPSPRLRRQGNGNASTGTPSIRTVPASGCW